MTENPCVHKIVPVCVPKECGVELCKAREIYEEWSSRFPEDAKKYSKNLEKIINLSIILGSIMALWFIYLQKFVLEAWCRYCLVVDVAMFIALAVIIFWKR